MARDAHDLVDRQRAGADGDGLEAGARLGRGGRHGPPSVSHGAGGGGCAAHGVHWSARGPVRQVRGGIPSQVRRPSLRRASATTSPRGTRCPRPGAWHPSPAAGEASATSGARLRGQAIGRPAIVGSRWAADAGPAYRPPAATSSSCVPASTSRPPSSTAIRSASRTVDSRCAMVIVVRPRASSSSARCSARSVAVSSALSPRRARAPAGRAGWCAPRPAAAARHRRTGGPRRPRPSRARRAARPRGRRPGPRPAPPTARPRWRPAARAAGCRAPTRARGSSPATPRRRPRRARRGRGRARRRRRRSPGRRRGRAAARAARRRSTCPSRSARRAPGSTRPAPTA